jgi:nucleoid-associated protein YgaU
MRLPAVAIACAFASGSAMGLWPGIAQHESSPEYLRVALADTIVAIVAAFFLAARDSLKIAATLSVAAWIVVIPPRSSSSVCSKPESQRCAPTEPSLS